LNQIILFLTARGLFYMSFEFEGGLEVDHEVAVAAHLPIGQENSSGDRIGPGYVPTDEQEAQDLGRAAAESTRPLTVTKAAYCIDGRGYVRVGDIEDPAELEAIVAPQLPGGTYLAATKAAVAANVTAVRDAKSFTEAFDIVAGILGRAGIEDSYHEQCGADKNADSDEQVDPETAHATFSAAGWASEDERGLVDQLHANRKTRIEAGFYKGWSTEVHQDRVRRQFPQHYAVLETSHDPTHNHHEAGAYDVEEEGLGFAKNEFIRRTGGKQLFAYTRAYAHQLADVLGGSPEERRMLQLGFDYDLLDVGNVLFARPEGEPGDPGHYPGMAFLK
jgi:hypothetical protein